MAVGELEQDSARAPSVVGLRLGRLVRRIMLTPAVLDALRGAFREHVSRDDAAARVGIGRQTLFDWITRGKRETQGLYHELAEAAKIHYLELRRKRRLAGREAHRRRR